MTRDLSDILDAILAGVVVLGEKGEVEEVNPAAYRYLEVTNASGLPVEKIFGAEHTVARLARRVLDEGLSASEGDVAIDSRSRGSWQLDVNVSPLRDRDERVNGALVVLRNRELQKRLSQLEEERDRNESFGHIAAGLAHEIKNPLAGIRGAGELLSHRATDDKTRETAQLVVREATRIAALVDELMVFSASDGIEVRLANIHEILDGVIDVLEHDPVATGVSTQRAYDPSLPEFLCDSNRLTQVFFNLLRNAYQAVSDWPSRRVEIETRLTLDHQSAKPGEPRTPRLRVRICDSGPGFSPTILPDATTPFVTNREGGTGLGLAVAQHWVNLHDGFLQVGNRPGGGAEVHVILPLRRI